MEDKRPQETTFIIICALVIFLTSLGLGANIYLSLALGLVGMIFAAGFLAYVERSK